jgi:hypothetical protein
MAHTFYTWRRPPPALWEVAIMSKMKLTLMLKIVWHVRKFGGGGLSFKHAPSKTMTPSILNNSELFYIIRQRKKNAEPEFANF